MGAAVLAVATLVASLAWRSVPSPPASLPLRDVSLEMHGDGQLAGTMDAPRVHWNAGTLDVVVTPHRGVQLEVLTPEAAVRVVGTAFTVARAEHATQVSVHAGTVRVTCEGEPERELSGNAALTCLPTDPLLLLQRLTELYAARAAPEVRLATAARARARAGAGSRLLPEILAHQTLAFADAGDDRAALGSAEAYLATRDPTRRDEMLSFAARTGYRLDGCSAVPALERAALALPPGPERLLLATCLSGTDPERARRWLEAADTWATGEWRDLADELRRRVGP